jgi:hypothetical protein
MTRVRSARCVGFLSRATLGFLALTAVVGSADAATSDWQAVAVTCVPDDDTTPAEYNAVTAGTISFSGTTTGSIFFWCNVLSPEDVYGVAPSWNALFLTNKDTGPNSFVEAKLYRKRRDTGALATNATLRSSNSAAVKENSLFPIPDFDFTTYAYFVRVELNRTGTSENPEFHIVSLGETIE